MLKTENDDLATPFVAKVPIEINPGTPTKARSWPSFSPESVLGPAVLVPGNGADDDNDDDDDCYDVDFEMMVNDTVNSSIELSLMPYQLSLSVLKWEHMSCHVGVLSLLIMTSEV